MIEPNEINAKNEINKTIAVLKARIQGIIDNSTNADDFPEEQLNALSFSIYSLERWRDDEVTNFIPEVARQLIWFKQVDQLKE
jgi:hypothetical protein